MLVLSHILCNDTRYVVFHSNKALSIAHKVNSTLLKAIERLIALNNAPYTVAREAHTVNNAALKAIRGSYVAV